MDEYDDSSMMSEFLDFPDNENENVEFVKVEQISNSDDEDIFYEEVIMPDYVSSEASTTGSQPINEKSHEQPKVSKLKRSIKLKEEVVLTLINTVRSMPELWKQDAPGYRDLCVQQQAWNTIAAQFGVPVENLKEKWKMLRTQFRSNHSKVRNKRLNGSDAEHDYQPTWFAYEAMKFLRDGDVPNSDNPSTAAASVQDPSGGYPDDTDAREVILELIRHIQQRPALWDKTHQYYKNAAVQYRAWKTLEQRLHLPIADMKRKWQHLRVQLRNNLRKVKAMSAAGEEYQPTWFAYEAMQFIRKNYCNADEQSAATPEISVKQPSMQVAVVPTPPVPIEGPTVSREYKRHHSSPIRTPEKVPRLTPCTSTTPPTSSPIPKPESIRPVSYVTNCKVEPFIIRTFRNLSKITDQIAQTKASPYSGLLDHLGSVLGRKRQRDFKEIETVLLNCLRELQKFPDVTKESLQGEAETDDEEQLF
uniref:MADF domain-containing protein n=1 Tax=Anopheles gambiae TaxID=7165 RepID=A0A1S4GNV5_ANOGA